MPGGTGDSGRGRGDGRRLPLDDVDGRRAALEPHLDDLAAVIVEPVPGSGGVLPASSEILAFLRELTQDAGALLVFDKIVSFRMGCHE